MPSSVSSRFLRSHAAKALLRAASFRRNKSDALKPEQVVAALYRTLLEREPDPVGLSDKVADLRSGSKLDRVIRGFISSAEFRSRVLQAVVPTFELPDLTVAMPEKYRKVMRGDVPLTIYHAQTDDDISRMVGLIERHRYYDAFGVWSPVIDLDKEVTAAIVRGLGARSCLELGCFTGPVLSLLADSGVSVTGSEVSHTAFSFAYPNVREHIIFGDLLNLDIDRRFDVVLCMDVLEHVSPIRLQKYVDKILSLLNEDGFVYLNSPMYGNDAVFGTVFGAYLDEWRSVGDRSFWRLWACDEKGWPEHGHLIWASVNWWSQMFEARGLVRDTAIEQIVHRHLSAFFDRAPARRSLFVLTRPENVAAANVPSGLGATLERIPNLPRAGKPEPIL